MSNYNDMGFEPRSNFEPLEIGEYEAVIHGVIGLGLHPVTYKDEVKTPSVFIKVVYEIPGLVRSDGNTTVIGQRIKLSNHEKSNCFKVLKSLYGTAITKQSCIDFIGSTGLKNLLGRAVTITVGHFEKEDNLIPYVELVSKLDPRLPQPKAVREVFFFNPLSPDIEVFKQNITQRTQSEIMGALNSEQFPVELHEEWAKIQENIAPNKNNDKDNGSTGAIE